MSDLAVIEAEVRDRAGKGAARATRRNGRVPAVIYGAGKDPVAISIDPGTLQAELKKPGFFITQFKIHAAGDEHQVMPREVQFHPITDDPLHVDFLRVTERTRVTVSVPVEFLNEEEAPGLKDGVLNIVRHDVEVRCTVGNMPEMLTADLTGLEIGDSVRISNIDLPNGVKPTIEDRDFLIATIAPPTIIVEEEEEEGEEEEGVEGEEAEEGAEGEEAEGGEEEEGED